MIDTFRKEYKPLSDDQKAYMELFKEKAEELLQAYKDAEFLNPESRYLNVAVINLEQSIMWAVKAIT